MKKVIAGLIIFLLLGISSGVVWAYLVSDDQKVNKVSFNDTEINITEEFDPPGVLTPGMVIKKVPRIQNLSESPCYVRVRVSFSDQSARERCEELQILEGWTLGSDGFYYYDRALKAKEETGALFNKVVIKKDAKGEELKPFDIDIYAEAVQDDGSNMEEAWNRVTGGGA